MLLGDGAIQLLTLIIGANLLKGLRTSRTPKFMIIGIIVARYIVLPSIGIGVVKAAVLLNLVHADPLYQFVLLLQFALPPATNIGTMMQLSGKGESECSVIMLCCYVCALVSLSLSLFGVLSSCGWLVSFADLQFYILWTSTEAWFFSFTLVKHK